MSATGHESPELALGTVLVRNTAANFAGQAAVMLLSFFSVPYVAHHLGAARYGLFVLLTTYIEAFNVLNLGINSTLVKYIAELIPGRHFEEIQSYLGTSVTVFLGGGLVIAAAACASANWIASHFLATARDLDVSLVPAIWIASAAFVVRLVGQALAAVLMATQRFDLLNVITVSTELTRIIGTIVAVYFGYWFTAILLVTLLCDSLACLCYMLVARRVLPQVSRWLGFSLEHFQSLVSFSKYVAIGNITIRIVTSADNVLIAYFLPVSNLAYYAIPYSLGQKVWLLVGNIAPSVFTAASHLSSAGDVSQLRELYLRGMKATLVVALLPSLLLYGFGRSFLLYWIGADFAQQGTTVLKIVMVGFLLNALSIIPHKMLQATGAPALAARFAILYLVSSVTLFVLFVPQFGIVGAAAGFLASQFLVVGGIVGAMNKRIGIGWRELFRHSLGRPLVALAAASVVCFAAQMGSPSLPQFAVAVMATTLAYLGLSWLVALDQRERGECVTFVNHLLRKLW